MYLQQSWTCDLMLRYLGCLRRQSCASSGLQGPFLDDTTRPPRSAIPVVLHVLPIERHATSPMRVHPRQNGCRFIICTCILTNGDRERVLPPPQTPAVRARREERKVHQQQTVNLDAFLLTPNTVGDKKSAGGTHVLVTGVGDI